MNTRENIVLFDRYSRNEMNETEREAFEERLTHSESFKKAFKTYVTLAGEIKEGAEYLFIQNELKEMHADLYGKKKRKPIPLFKKKYWIPLSIAASIALLLYFNPFWSGTMDQKMGDSYGYEPLANHTEDNDTEELSQTMTEEEFLMETSEFSDSINQFSYLSNLKDTLETISTLPSGTAFLISEDGFFLTSKHLVEGHDIIQLQHKEIDLAFEASVIYSDSLLDFAILQSSISSALNFEAVPYEIVETSPDLGDPVFTLGYPKKEIVYTEGVVSSETGFESDSIYFEISLPSNAGHSGAPLFNEKGELIGIVTAQNSEKQAVTYVLKHDYIRARLTNQLDQYSIDMSTNYTKKRIDKKRRIKLYRSFVFEVHTNTPQ